jgi:transketolase
MKKQTVVEWFAMKLAEKLGMPNAISFYVDNEKEILQAKEMEKEQKANTWNNAINAVEKDKWESFEQYYNETYGGNK